MDESYLHIEAKYHITDAIHRFITLKHLKNVKNVGYNRFTY